MDRATDGTVETKVCLVSCLCLLRSFCVGHDFRDKQSNQTWSVLMHQALLCYLYYSSPLFHCPLLNRGGSGPLLAGFYLIWLPNLLLLLSPFQHFLSLSFPYLFSNSGFLCSRSLGSCTSRSPTAIANGPRAGQPQQRRQRRRLCLRQGRRQASTTSTLLLTQQQRGPSILIQGDWSCDVCPANETCAAVDVCWSCRVLFLELIQSRASPRKLVTQHFIK